MRFLLPVKVFGEFFFICIRDLRAEGVILMTYDSELYE